MSGLAESVQRTYVVFLVEIQELLLAENGGWKMIGRSIMVTYVSKYFSFHPRN